MGAKKGLAATILVLVLLLGVAYFLGYTPRLHNTTTETSTQKTPSATTTTSTQGGSQGGTMQTGQPSNSGGTTTSTPQGQSGEAPGTSTMGLPRLATSVSLEDLASIINGSLEQATAPWRINGSMVANYTGTPLEPVLEYYNMVMSEDLANITKLFDLSIVDNESLVEAHRVLFEKYDLKDYNISDVKYYDLGEANINGQVIIHLYAVEYVFQGVYVDINGTSYNVTSHLITYLDRTSNPESPPSGPYLIVQTVPAS